MRRILFCLLFVAVSAHAETKPESGIDSLRRFFNDTQTFSARFKQVVLDETLHEIQESSGNLWIGRPNKFRWDYDKPFKQEIVGDGTTIWMYDKELAQITRRPLAGGLGATPAVLLSGRGRLEENFTVKALDPQGNMERVQLIPKNKDGGFENIRIGFEAGKLRMLEMVDGFGNTTRVMLDSQRENPSIGPEKFQFTPPKGVDVLGE